MAKLAILTMGAILASTIVVPGACFLTSTAREPVKVWYFVSRIDELSQDGTPQQAVVRVARRNAGTRLPEETVGRVYLRRIPETGELIALRTVHSRGSSVLYDDEKRVFRCGCWDIEFDLNGNERDGRFSAVISQVKVKVEGGEVFVRLH
jgi:hypothetical protein